MNAFPMRGLAVLVFACCVSRASASTITVLSQTQSVSVAGQAGGVLPGTGVPSFSSSQSLTSDIGSSVSVTGAAFWSDAAPSWGPQPTQYYSDATARLQSTF